MARKDGILEYTIDEYEVQRWKDSNGNIIRKDEMDKRIADGEPRSSFEEWTVYLSVSFKGEIIDEGVGYTEYWGKPGYDSHLTFELHEVEKAIDMDDWKTDWLAEGRLTDKEEKELYDHCQQKGWEFYQEGEELEKERLRQEYYNS